jgi:hypothetical protein
MRFIRDSINVKYHLYQRGGFWFVRRRRRAADGTFVNHNAVSTCRPTLIEAIEFAHHSAKHDREMKEQARGTPLRTKLAPLKKEAVGWSIERREQLEREETKFKITPEDY